MRSSNGNKSEPNSPRRPYRGEDGDTLIEVLLALVVMGITVLAIMAAFMTSLSSSSTLRTFSIDDSTLRTVSEQIVAQFEQGSTYLACPDATPAAYTSALGGALTIPAPYSTAGYSATITAVTYWNGASFSDTVSSCAPSSTVPEQLTVTVDGPNNSSVSATFVVEGTGQIFSTPVVQLNPPTNLVLTAPSTVSGALTVTFTGSNNAPSSPTQYYSAEACVNSEMSAGCSPVISSFLSGENLTGLSPDTRYWVSVWANASPGYLQSAPATAGPQTSSGTASIPIVTSVSPGPVSGSLVITFTPPSTAPSGETYTATACPGSTMTSGCPQQSDFTSGETFAPLTPGTSYTVTITAVANGSFSQSTSEPYGPTMATVQLPAPTITSVNSSTVDAGAIVVDFNYSPPASWPPNQPQDFTALACTSSSMTPPGCVSVSPYVSGQQLTGLSQTNPPTSYYVTVTANSSPGYLAATSSVWSPPVPASVALSPPTVSIKNKNTGSGTLDVQITPGTNAPRGVTYSLSVCPSGDPTTDTCIVPSSISSNSGGGNTSYTVTGLQSGASYNVMAMENAMPDYLASNWSAVVTGTAN